MATKDIGHSPELPSRSLITRYSLMLCPLVGKVLPLSRGCSLCILILANEQKFYCINLWLLILKAFKMLNIFVITLINFYSFFLSLLHTHTHTHMNACLYACQYYIEKVKFASGKFEGMIWLDYGIIINTKFSIYESCVFTTLLYK